MNNYIVYCHTCKINNKKYIGITCRTLQKRSGYNGYNYLTKSSNGKYHQPLFARAILKWGWDNFNHEIFFDNLTEQQAKKLEKQLIKTYNTIDPNYGYNISSGGDGNTKYSTDEEREQALKNSQLKSYKKHKQQLLENEDLQAHCSNVRKTWYHNKIKTNEVYHSYVLEKSKLSHIRHSSNLTKEQKAIETKHSTDLARKNRAEQKSKKLELQKLISDYNIETLSETTKNYIESIKWYKVQSMKKLLEIEQKLKTFINNSEE